MLCYSVLPSRCYAAWFPTSNYTAWPSLTDIMLLNSVTSDRVTLIGKIPALRKWPWGNAKFWVIFLKPQNQSKGFKHAHAALEHHLNQTKIDIFFSAIFWDKLRGHFRMLKSQNISHALCAHFSWLRTARWDEKSGWWRCPKLDANTLPNSQQPKRKKTQNVSKKIKLSQLQILF